LAKALAKFKARPGTYLLIPCVAALVGYVTNWLAVQMIFYPIRYVGIPLYRRPQVPLGIIGWQGIVPCKTKPMTLAMLHMVTTHLLSVQQAFARLSPHKIAKLLEPQIPILMQDVMQQLSLPPLLRSVPTALFQGLPPSTQSLLQHHNRAFLIHLVQDMQRNIDHIFNIETCVVEQMMKDRSKLGTLFQKCGSQELTFLTNSGLWLGFLLGLLQMMVALVWDNPWSLSIGGAIVGCATNWLALKWIFEPVNPTQLGPFLLQGQFLKRQPQVAKEFSAFFAGQILTSQQLWKSLLEQDAFATLFAQHLQRFVNRVTSGVLGRNLEPETLALVARTALHRLPHHVPVLYDYMDQTLNLETTLRTKMEAMTSEQFERVLHPIFEEDELTLILAGAALGFAAGLIQQGLETGHISLEPLRQLWLRACQRIQKLWRQLRKRSHDEEENQDNNNNA
jgi:uncharacterized membrane protein YheB (UPF0754 family)